MSDGRPAVQSPTLEPARRITVILPDDGTDRRLIRALRQDHGITRADSVAIRAVAALRRAKTRKGRLPEAELAQRVTVIVDAGEADTVFDFIHSIAHIDRPGGGILMMERLLGALPFVLPGDVRDERD